MAGLKKGYVFDDWRPTKRYERNARKEIEFGLATYFELLEMFCDEYFYGYDDYSYRGY